MSYTLKNDPITSRLYYQLESGELNQELANRIDFANLVIAQSEGLSRFLLEDGTLVLVENILPAELHAQLMQFAPHTLITNSEELNHNIFSIKMTDIHGSVQLKCNTCDENKEHDFIYDFSPSGHLLKYMVDKTNNQTTEKPTHTMNLYLTNKQAKDVYQAVNSIYESASNGLYKYIDHFQNCVSVAINTYRDSGLPHHLANFYTDEILIKRDYSFVGGFIFSDRIYRPANLNDPDRYIVSNFMKSVYGDDYAIRWKTEDPSTGTILLELPVDIEQAQSNQAILARIDEIIEMRKNYYPQFIKLWSPNSNITSEQLEPFITSNITNLELYYGYLIKFEFEKQKLLLQLPYNKHFIMPPFGEKIANLCVEEKVDFNIEYKPVCKELCQVSLDHFKSLIDEEDIINQLNDACSMWQDNGICKNELIDVYSPNDISLNLT